MFFLTNVAMKVKIYARVFSREVFVVCDSIFLSQTDSNECSIYLFHLYSYRTHFIFN